MAVPTNALESAIASCSDLVWSVPALRPVQVRAAAHLADASKPRYLLMVERPGGGKTHVAKLTGVIEKGITLLIVPLLTLSADSLAKFTVACQDYGTVEAHHIDEVWKESKAKYFKLLNRMRGLPINTSSTIFVFSSPQFIVNHNDFRRVLIDAARARVLRAIFVDECHLYVQQGVSFREEIRVLTFVFWGVIFHKRNEGSHPKVVFMTGTMYKSYVPMLSTLTTIGLPDDSIHWGGTKDFAQHNIHMQYINSKHHVRHLDKVVDFLRCDPTHFACVFCASKKGSIHLCTKLEDKLNEAGFDGFDVDVVHVHGSLQAEEKFILIRIFCEKYNVPELSARVLLATAAANVGIDNHLVLFIMTMGWTRDLLTYFQQRGRACRLDGQEAVCIQIGDTGSFVGLMWTIAHSTKDTKLDDDADDIQAQLAGLNCASSPMKKNIPTETEGRKGPRKRLTKTQRKRNDNRCREELLDVLRFHCLDFGCQHIRGQQFMACGELELPPRTSDLLSCRTKCSVCTGQWSRYFLPVVKTKVISFLQFIDRKKLPLPARGNNILELLWDKSEKVRLHAIFKKTNVQMYNVDCLFLQLAANSIIKIVNIEKQLHWIIGERPDPENEGEHLFIYNDERSWLGINTIT